LQTAAFELSSIPQTMQAAVYRGASVVAVEEIPTPEIGTGEILIRVEACGICHTDLKKSNTTCWRRRVSTVTRLPAWSRRWAAVSTKFQPGDRVVAFHHIPCGTCFYCQRKIYAQCPTYKKVGITAGFEPAGGDSPNTSASWIGSSSAASNGFPTHLL